MDWAATFSVIPNAIPLCDLTDGWHWSDAPGFAYIAALSPDRKHVFQAYAHDSYDEDLAVAILSFARDNSAALIAPPERPLTIAEGFAHPRYGFDMVVAISPTVHRYHNTDAELHQATRALLPAYRCEFAGDEGEADTQYRYARAAGVPGTRWGRQPHPYLKMRYRTDSGRVHSKRGFVPDLSHLVSWVTSHDGDPDLFVELENYQHDVYVIGQPGGLIITGPDGRTRQLALTELADVVKPILYGPNLDAAATRPGQ